MEDLKWLAIILVMAGVILLYVRLLGDPGSESGAGAGEEAGA